MLLDLGTTFFCTMRHESWLDLLDCNSHAAETWMAVFNFIVLLKYVNMLFLIFKHVIIQYIASINISVWLSHICHGSLTYTHTVEYLVGAFGGPGSIWNLLLIALNML